MSNFTTVLSNTSVDEIEDVSWTGDFRYANEGVIQGLVGIAGLIGNVMSILVLLRKDMDLKPNFMQILTTLITFDIFCIIFNLSLFCLPLIWSAYFDHVFPYIVPYILPLAQIALTGSIYSTLAVAIERYVSVCHPHFVGYSEAGKLSVAGLILFSLVFNICRFLEFETTYEERTESILNEDTHLEENVTYMKAIAKATPLREDTVYTQVTMVLMLVVNGVLPLMVLIVLNTKIYWAIKERMRRLASLTSRQKRDVDVAGVLVGIILVFIVCHSFKFFVNIYEFYIMHAGMGMESWTNTLDVFVSFSHLLATLNSSINFVIYCYKDEKFRNSFVAMVSTFTHKDQGIIVV